MIYWTTNVYYPSYLLCLQHDIRGYCYTIHVLNMSFDFIFEAQPAILHLSLFVSIWVGTICFSVIVKSNCVDLQRCFPNTQRDDANRHQILSEVPNVGKALAKNSGMDRILIGSY